MTSYQTQLKNKTILYVEDNHSIREEYCEIFEIIFKEAYCVDNAKVAFEIYKEKKFDVILSDINMPHISGIEFAKMVRNINPEQKIISLSGNVLENEDERMLFDECLLKPIDIFSFFNILIKKD